MNATIYAWLKRLEALITALRTDLTTAQADIVTPWAVLTTTTGSTAVTAAQAKKGIYLTNTGAGAAVTYTLPAATQGMKIVAVVKAAQELRLDPNGTETIALPATGVQQAAGKYITADALSESIALVCTVTGTWDPVGATDGTWGVEA